VTGRCARGSSMRLALMAPAGGSGAAAGGGGGGVDGRRLEHPL
jgi:hypothetical protein